MEVASKRSAMLQPTSAPVEKDGVGSGDNRRQPWLAHGFQVNFLYQSVM
jgi:hypothetical protein